MTGRGVSDNSVNEGVGPERAAEMKRIVWLVVTPTRVRTRRAWGADSAKRSASGGTKREAGGVVCRTRVFEEEVYVAKLCPAITNIRLVTDR